MKQRNTTIDYIKAIGVIGVMIMHLHTPIRYVAPIITNCYIPLFFICSGYTTSPDKTINLKRKCSSLMFPYIFYYLLFFILVLLGVIEPTRHEIIGFLYSRSEVAGINLQSLSIGPSWFLTAMLSTFVLYKAMSYIKTSILSKAILTGTLGMLIASFCKINLPWSLENVAMLLSYIYIGQMLRPHIDNQQKPMWIFVPILIYVFGAIYNGNVGFSLSEYGRNIVLCYALPILAFWILFKILPPPFSNINSSRMFRLGSYIGKNSLTIFMSHMLFYYMYKYVFDNNVFNGFYIFQEHHFLLQGFVVFLTVISTILTCKWQSLQLENIKAFISKYGSSDK